MVVDYRFLNSHIQAQRFRCQDLSSLKDIILPHDYMCVLDLQDGYRHIPLHPDAQPLLAFNILGRHFQPLSLNFGLTTAPYVFTKCMSAPLAHLRAQGIRVSVYLDDFIIAAPSRSAAILARDKVVALLQSLGLSVHPTKGVWEPSQRVTYLGLEVDCSGEAPVFRIPSDKRDQVRHVASKLLKNHKARGHLSLRSLQSFCGLTNFLSKAMLCARFFNREIYNCLKQQAKFRRQKHKATAQTWPQQPIVLSDQALHDIQWWRDSPLLETSSRQVKEPSLELAVRLTTDASDEGWGCLLGDEVTGADRWDRVTASRHINAKELQAVECALALHIPQVSNRRVLLFTDNTSVCHILRSGTTRSPDLIPDLRRIWALLLDNSIDLHPRYIPTELNPADAPSRKVDAYGQQLLPSIFQDLDQQWGPHHVDRFADSANALLPKYHTFWPSPKAFGTPDAFTNSWATGVSWMYPPFPLVGRTLRHLQESNGVGTLVAPAWPGQPWWPVLQQLAVHTVDLCHQYGVSDPAQLHSMEAPANNWFHTHPPEEGPPHHTWHLMAFFLDFRTQH